MDRRQFLGSAAASFVAGSALLKGAGAAEQERPTNVLVWDEQQEVQVRSGAYENYLGNAIAEFLATVPGLKVVSASIKEPEQGLSAERVNTADVILWWGHVRHADVDDSRVESVIARVKKGEAVFVALHSAHYSKPFTRLLGTRCGFAYVDSNRGRGYREKLRIVNPTHPITKGLSDFEIPRTEIYAEPFEVPFPDKILIYGHWDNGHSFPDLCYWSVGAQGVLPLARERVRQPGKVVYFRPGHETFPIFKQPEVQEILKRIVLWSGEQVRRAKRTS